jgi:DNA transformation protein
MSRSTVAAMTPPSPFVEHIVDLLRGFGPVVVKPLFGVWGLYHDGVLIGLVAHNALYLKADAQCAADFDAQGLEAFVYESKVDERIVTSYRRAPDSALEDASVMTEWATIALQAALRTRGAKGGKRRRTEA